MDRRSFLGSLGALFATSLVAETATAEVPPGERAAAELRAAAESLPELPPSVEREYVGINLDDPTTIPAARIQVCPCVDAELMIGCIAAHSKKTGDIILSMNDIYRPGIAFISLPETPDGVAFRWVIGIARLGRSLNRWERVAIENDPPAAMQWPPSMTVSERVKVQLIRTCLKTPNGQKMLAAAFPGQRPNPYLKSV